RFRLEDVSRQSLQLVCQRAREKGVELLFAVSGPELVGDAGALMGDPLRLGQVLTNLLSNAVKFTLHGHVKLTIAVERADAEAMALRFTVRDSGIGLSPGQTDRLFEEFTQADGSTTRQYGGTGLGLTISKRVVELMGGRIWVESVQGAGSRFHFTARFPRTSPPAPPFVPVSGAAALRVLVVDGEGEARLALKDQLMVLGVARNAPGLIALAENAEQAASALEQAHSAGLPFDLVLVDWATPGLAGKGILESLRWRLPSSRSALVVVSADESLTLHDAALALGVRRFLTKPVLPESLGAVIGRMDGRTAEADLTALQPVQLHDFSGLRVLLMEDHPVNQQLVVELMEGHGAQIEVADNGKVGLEMVCSHPVAYYDVVLMDLQMPVMDGYEATQILRADPQYAELPIFAMTAHAMADEKQRCMALGMSGHFSKPIDPEVLFEMLARLRGKGQARASIAARASAWPASGKSVTVTVRPDAASSADWLPELLRLLEQGDHDAKEFWRARQEDIAARLPLRARQEISHALAGYDFDGAILLLRR
ncbi:MAG: response regulator, partial [Burkholderiaceae bacterium]